ncbi:TlpA family protein disulfide reductase [Permianibacter sp. IMCC34836]|uniref:TlpA family protein disulfide reductase n=1 Tax=Permianibacter fluminis TaxID=2738515 RepID=UPI001554D42E|nr:TlpA disulfide reductase family protein [Permianibacter fluminis]NQD35878.1 TlpA family protein disulfide reductase [Permianibacter fluminis]
MTKTVLAVFVLLTSLLQAPVASAIEVGETASLPLGVGPDGEPLKPEQLRGKVVVGLYWASWCQYCRKAMPDFLQFQQVAEKAGLQVVLINVKEDREVLRSAKKWAKDSTVVMAHDRKGDAMAGYGGEGFPYIVLIDRQGVVQNLRSGYGAKSKAFYVNALNTLLKGESLADDSGGFRFEWVPNEESSSAADTAPAASAP